MQEARDADEAPPEAREAQSKESPPPPNAEAPTSPPLAGGSARDAGEAPPEAHEAANSARLDDGRYYFGISGFIDVVTVDAERSPHQFPLDVTPEGDNLPSNAEEAYDFFEAHQAILTPIRMETVVYLVHDGNFEATTYGSLLADDSQLDNPTRDNVREVRCLGRDWRSVSTINDWPDLIRAVGVWSLIAVTTDADMEEPMRSPVEEPAEAKDTEMGEVKDTAGEADPWLSLHAIHRRNVGTVTLERGRFLCDCAMCYGVDLRGNVVSKATRTRHRKLHGQIQPPAPDPEEIDAVVCGNRGETLRHTDVDVTMDDKEGEHAEEAGRTSAEDEVVHAQQDVEAKNVSSQGGEAGVPDDEDGDAPKTEDADGETKDDGGEDLGFDEEDDGDADHFVKAALVTQLESIVNAAKELFGGETDHNVRRSTKLLADLLEWNLEENLTQKSFSSLCEILLHNFDELRETHFPLTFAKAMGTFDAFSTPYQRVDMCVNGCCLYEKELENADHCPHCKECRWQSFGAAEEDGTPEDGTLKKPRLQFLWWPLKEFFRRLFNSPEVAELMRAHGRHTSPESGRKDTIWDGDAWKEKKARYPEFFQELRNIIILFCADGASVWENKAGVFPMYFQILNLPPEIRSKYEYLEVCGILNGIHPADTTLLYDKLVDELEELWETDCGVWGAFSEEYVLVRAAGELHA
ncbi:hypothetical protein CYMTET_4861 [Cymbomonas tetramitiformis]|uniref:Uncharacterized protein n=1 Tax=Cymbomonas tetramitiformis TaxID=36881 RepID=A0AAE0H0I9_9CHLO|nr:hypothetical protein CYMTET_4861 [Cymbomonas tetramitiformis]